MTKWAATRHRSHQNELLGEKKESTMDFPTFITHINDALAHENGIGLAYLLRPTSPHGKELVKQYRNPTVSLLQTTLPNLDLC